MIVIDLDGTIVFAHEGNPVCHKTHIPLDADRDIVVAFNPSSSLYNARNYELDPDEIEAWERENGKYKPSSKRPFEFNRWYMFRKRVQSREG